MSNQNKAGKPAKSGAGAGNQQQPVAAPEPNVALVARDKDGKTDVSKALTEINLPAGSIKMPAAEDQAEPFFHEKAEEITAAMPHLYKPFTKKGN